jgi:hypothetical protein
LLLQGCQCEVHHVHAEILPLPLLSKSAWLKFFPLHLSNAPF